MIKVSVMYRDISGARFDHGYYKNTHMPLVQRLLGDSCSYYTVDRGLSGGDPGTAMTYVAMCHIFSDSIESYASGMARNAAAILADIPNYTDLTPIIQISEVIVERSNPVLG